jgi:tetratricopeptide (TPR) repeat protein
MNDDILNVIRQEISELNRKTPRVPPWAVFLAIGLLLIFLATITVDVLHDAIRGWTKKPVDSWKTVEVLANRADLAAAYEMAVRLEKKAPNDYTAAYHKGDILVQMDKLDLALQAYEKAYQAYPDTKLEDRIATVKKALEMKTEPNNASQPTK